MDDDIINRCREVVDVVVGAAGRHLMTRDLEERVQDGGVEYVPFETKATKLDFELTELHSACRRTLEGRWLPHELQ